MAETRRLIPLLLVAALAGCSSPEQKLRAGLVGAGVPQSIANCMAPRMTDRLSFAQLRRLGEIKARRARGVGELIRELRALNDPEIVDVTATAAALCASGLAR
ncbi:hypothetical protein EWE75_15375 [Sphingomonas populi]|uniref:Lipoprotein n=1 Tax=Sphingomonas populi TaxID=2484750 RepID=A0A4Q6Y1H4_9SPHN|nr:hypothetical protein [Sphingomonas populi]RZF63564.1 hypothetical protein EWE75_15375 [Sphingomonas populi]